MFALIAAAALLCGCGTIRYDPNCADDDPTCEVPPTPPPCAYRQINYADVGGYHGDATLERIEYNYGTDCLNGTFGGVISLTPFNGVPFVPPAGGGVLMYFDYTSSTKVDIDSYPDIAMQVPPSVMGAFRTFHLAANYYDEPDTWMSNITGKLQVNGFVLHSPAGGNNDWEIDPGYPFVFCLYYTTN